jgi:hypothetical protein
MSTGKRKASGSEVPAAGGEKKAKSAATMLSFFAPVGGGSAASPKQEARRVIVCVPGAGGVLAKDMRYSINHTHIRTCACVYTTAKLCSIWLSYALPPTCLPSTIFVAPATQSIFADSGAGGIRSSHTSVQMEHNEGDPSPEFRRCTSIVPGCLRPT